jgi:dTDP-glucose pyrophosphorylase
MSGSSRAFQDAGYLFPKNLTEVAGKPLVQRVLDQLVPLRATGAKTICVLRADEDAKHHTGAVIHLLDKSAGLVLLRGDTSGAPCSALLAVDRIDNDEPLVILNGDQIVDVDFAAVVQGFQQRKLDGGIIVFEDIHPRWSFVKCNAQGIVIETAEKRPISKLATAGFYYFDRGRDFVQGATAMIAKDAHVNGVFYICPVYNELILSQRVIGVHQVPRSAYKSLASPIDVQAYAENLDIHVP